MAKDKIAKTNAARLLDRDKVKYELVPYEVDENDLSCVHVAATLGENIEQVFKTLVTAGKSGKNEGKKSMTKIPYPKPVVVCTLLPPMEAAKT